MIYPRALIETLESFEPSVWRGSVFRHMFADYEPLLQNRRGARWNPSGTPAIYTSLERETVLAEAEHLISSQPLRPVVRRTLYTIDVDLNSVLDLSEPETMAQLGLQSDALADANLSRCQLVGGAVEWLGHDGLLVPSARAEGTNLVIFPNQHDKELEVVQSEEIAE